MYLLAYAVIALFSYLIINWGFNFAVQRIVREGIGAADAAGAAVDAPKGGKSTASTSSTGSKCPEDCTSVKELQKKLSDATKKVATLEEDIVANTNASVQHSIAITNLNQSINEMQKKQEDK